MRATASPPSWPPPSSPKPHPLDARHPQQPRTLYGRRRRPTSLPRRASYGLREDSCDDGASGSRRPPSFGRALRRGFCVSAALYRLPPTAGAASSPTGATSCTRRVPDFHAAAGNAGSSPSPTGANSSSTRRVVPDFHFGAPIAAAAGNAGSSSTRATSSTRDICGGFPNFLFGAANAGSCSTRTRDGGRFPAFLFGGGRVPGFLSIARAGNTFSTTICHGAGSIGAGFTSNSNSHDPTSSNSKPALFDPNPRSRTDIASWIELARLQTTFKVAFDAGVNVIESGRDLRRVLDAIGDIDITTPVRPGISSFLCTDNICAVIGEDKLYELFDARIPFEEDQQFGFSALAAQSMTEAIEKLMVILHSLLHPVVVPNFALSNSCPVILKQLLGVVSEFSTLVESTKFRTPQSCIRYPMLEAHALALEHACAIALDVYEEAWQEKPKDEWASLRQQLRNRRLVLFEQDFGILDYILSTGVTDTESV